MSVAVRTRIAFRLLGRSFLAFVLVPEPPLDDWLAELDHSLQRSMSFFANRPIILDLSRLSPTRRETEILIADVLGRNLRLIAVDSVDPAWLPAKFAPLPAGAQPVGMFETAPAGPDGGARRASSPPPDTASLLVDAPVRSGQSVIFPAGDIIVVGSVASGAELVAGGSVHVYGSLRGRAIAGSSGNARARIFCRKFEAEILVIDGLYKTAEDIEADLRGGPVQARLERDAMIVEALN
ncbi:MAG: septum site-determining protein MinC [Pseudomonadota bacterium]|nr:septum site-determining protein MinC [Pseudomonadota bacterium]